MKVAEIDRELTRATKEGPLRDIIIPPCPELLTQLRSVMQQADPDPADVSNIASADVAMAASLIRFANSPLYARSRPAAKVGDAVAMLGMGQTVNILTGFLTRNALPVHSPLLEHFWETSTRRALAMGYIARQLYGVDPDLAHTCGLFCHVGIPVMMQGVPGYAGTLVEALARQDRSFTETENSAHRTDHAVVGAIVARTWRLPPAITVAVRLHHDFTCLSDTSIPAEARALVAMALVAEHLVANHEGVKKQTEWLQYGPACVKHLHISLDEVDAWVDTLHPLLESVRLG